MASVEEEWFEAEASEEDQAAQCEKVARVLDLITATLTAEDEEPGLQDRFACKQLPPIGFAEFARRFVKFGGISSDLLVAGLLLADRALKTKHFTKRTTVHK